MYITGEASSLTPWSESGEVRPPAGHKHVQIEAENVSLALKDTMHLRRGCDVMSVKDAL